MFSVLTVTSQLSFRIIRKMAEAVMETDQSSDLAKIESTSNLNPAINELVQQLISCKNVYYRSQQRGDAELSTKEKTEIAFKIFESSKSNFLQRFGKHLKEEHLDLFTQYTSDKDDGYAVSYYLSDLKRFFSKAKRETDVKNRRYFALKKLVEGNSYFTETEMMRRNPLLYEQLVGQYLCEEEKKTRDNIDTKNITFVNLLLESIDRNWLKKRRKEQQDAEDEQFSASEEDSSVEESPSEAGSSSCTKSKCPKAKKVVESDSWDEEVILSGSTWGEIAPKKNDSDSQNSHIINLDFARSNFSSEADSKNVVMITASERRLLKEEFISTMYQNFLDGKDADFDYSTVDDNDEYDNLDIKTHDAEESYFDSQTPEDVPPDEEKMATGSETSEDELDVYMNRLNQHHSLVEQLSNGIKENM